MKRVRADSGGKVELEITPMIDVIFLLLSFFVMTFKIVAPEGDFNIKMPLTAPSSGPPPESSPPIQVYLYADMQGDLSNIVFDTSSLGPKFPALRGKLIDWLGDSIDPAALEDTEIEIHADARLHYENVIEAITAMSGYVDPETSRVVRLVEKIRFAPPGE